MASSETKSSDTAKLSPLFEKLKLERTGPELAQDDKTKTIVIYGDSNTFGAGPNGARLAQGYRWGSLLEKALSEQFPTRVIEEGLNGRTTIHDDPGCVWLKPNRPTSCNGRLSLLPVLHSHKPIDLVIIALGVNDLKSRFSLTAYDICDGAKLLAEDVADSSVGRNEGAPPVLIVCPAKLSCEKVEWGMRGRTQVSADLSITFAALAETGLPVAFGEGCDLINDGVHYSADGHVQLAQKVYEAIQSHKLLME